MKPFQRRQFLFLAGGAGLLQAVFRVAWAQTYPTLPVHVIVGFPVGGGIDIVARLVGKWLSDRLSQPFDVENRTGAGSNIATEAVVRAPADGFTLLLATAANAISPALNPNLSFNFIRDTAPVAGVSRIPIFMVVAPFSPFKTVSDFTAHAKANLSRTSIGTTFAGTPVFLAAALFKSMAGLDVPLVHHPSDAAGLADLQAGKVQVHFAGAGAVTEDIKAGKLRALGVTTLMRSELLPGVPTIADTVPGYEVSSWAGFAAPRATPPEIIDRLNREINLGLADAQVKARLAELGHEPMPMTSAEFGKFVAAETEKWGKVVKLAGIKPQ